MEELSTNGITYFSIENLTDFQSELLDILKYIDTLCKENKIEYFLDGGSSIGAKRHNGFIPWDDDLDIALLKEDYLKLVSVISQDKNKQFYLYDEDLKNSFCGYLAKKSNYFQVINNGSRKRANLIPPKIDIRPFNVIEKSNVEASFFYRDVSNYITFGSTHQFDKSKVVQYLKDNSISDFYKFYNFKYGIGYDKSNKLLASPYFKYSYENPLDSNDIYPLEFSSFEGVRVNTPKNEFLESIYGDIYQLPNIKDRKPVANKIIKLCDFYASTINDYLYHRKNAKEVSLKLFTKYVLVKLLKINY